MSERAKITLYVVLFSIAVIALALFLGTVEADTPKTATIEWDANEKDPDIAKYGIYLESLEAPGGWEPLGTVDHPATTFEYEITESGPYTFGVSAIDQAGNESDGKGLGSVVADLPPSPPPSCSVVMED